MQVSLALTRPVALRPLSLGLGARGASVVAVAVAYALLLSARGWGAFVDESDNLLGGYLIAHGQALYRDYFSHHMPLPYWLATIPALVGVSDQIGFRVFASLVTLGVWTFIMVRFWGRIGAAILSVLILTIALGFPWFYGHMFLDDTFEAYAVLVLVLYLYAFPNLDWERGDQLVIALAIATAVLCNLMSIYPLAVLALYYAVRKVPAWRKAGTVAAIRGELTFIGLVCVPFVLAMLALLGTGAFQDFVQDAIVFNQVYYSKYALAADPMTIARLVLHSDYTYLRDNIHPLAWQTVNGFSLLSNVLACLMLLRKRRLGFVIAFLGVAALSRGRGVSFHDQAFYLLSFFSAALVGVELVRSLGSSDRSRIRRVGTAVGTLLALLLAGTFYAGLVRAFPWRYTDVAPDAYRDVVQATTDADETVWMLPLGFSGYLESKRMPATRYAFYLPWMADSPAINSTIIQDLGKSRPPLIIIPPHVVISFLKGDRVLPLDLDVYSRPLRDQLAADYAPISTSDERLQGVLLRRDRAVELQQRLRSAGLLRDETES